MPKCTRYSKQGIIRYLVALGYFRYFKYILTNNSTKYNVYSSSNAKWKVLEKIKKKLINK